MRVFLAALGFRKSNVSVADGKAKEKKIHAPNRKKRDQSKILPVQNIRFHSGENGE